MRVVLLKKLHLKGEGKIEDRWEAATADIYRQPEFEGHELTSVKTLREHYKKCMDAVKEKIGWGDENGGKTGNLSNHEGDLYELSRTVRQILLDEEEETEKSAMAAKQREADKLAHTETTVLMNGLAQEQRMKRGSGGSNGGSVTSGSSSGLKLTDSMLLELMQGGSSSSGPASKRKRDEEEASEDQLLQWFEEIGGAGSGFIEVVSESGCHGKGSLSDTVRQLEEVSFPVIANTFVQDGAGADAKVFKKEMGEFDVQPLVAHKLYVYLKEQSKKLARQAGMEE